MKPSRHIDNFNHLWLIAIVPRGFHYHLFPSTQDPSTIDPDKDSVEYRSIDLVLRIHLKEAMLVNLVGVSKYLFDPKNG